MNTKTNSLISCRAYTDAYLPVCGDGQDGNTHTPPPMRQFMISTYDDEHRKITGVTMDGTTIQVPLDRAYKDKLRSVFRRRDLIRYVEAE